MKVALEKEKGERLRCVVDDDGVIEVAIHDCKGRVEAYPWLSRVDLWGKTVFNRLQMEPVMTKWRQLMAEARTETATLVLKRVYELAEECGRQAPQYLSFYGNSSLRGLGWPHIGARWE